MDLQFLFLYILLARPLFIAADDVTKSSLYGQHLVITGLEVKKI